MTYDWKRMYEVVEVAAEKAKGLGKRFFLVHRQEDPCNPVTMIRCQARCPLEVAADRAEGDWLGAGKHLGLDYQSRRMFANVADGIPSVSPEAEALRRHMLNTLGLGIVLLLMLLAPSVVSASQMMTLSNGAMVPCDHPLAIADGKGCNQPQPVVQVLTPLPEPEPVTTLLPPVIVPPPPPYQGDGPLPFKLGRTYTRKSDGQQIFVAGLGQTSFGWQVWFMECRNTVFADSCPTTGAIWILFANTTANGWVEVE